MQTFVVRVWSAAASPPDAEPDRLRGVVQHIGTGRSETFTDGCELIGILREKPQPIAERAGTGGGP